MSDICDDTDDVRRLSEGGARFKGAFAKQIAPNNVEKKFCKKCGSRPVIGIFRDAEILMCPGCRRQTEPLKSRQALRAMWNGMN